MTEAAIVNEPVVDAGSQPVTPKEFRYEYQPTENGQPLGGKQVIVYDGTPEDLGRKMADQNTELIKLNRRLNKDLRLGNIIQDEIPQGAARFDESKYQLVPEPLTADERIKLAGDIVDPERFDAAAQRIVRASIGDPDALRTRLARLEQQAAKTNALEEAMAFKNSNPDYYACPENFKTLSNWIIKPRKDAPNGLEPVQENFQLAYDTLKEFMIPKPAAAPVVVPKTDEVPVTPAPIRPVSSGLTRSNGSDSGPVVNPGDEIVWNGKKGYAAIESMPGDEYKRKLLHESGFKEKVQALDNARAQKRAGV